MSWCTLAESKPNYNRFLGRECGFFQPESFRYTRHVLRTLLPVRRLTLQASNAFNAKHFVCQLREHNYIFRMGGGGERKHVPIVGERGRESESQVFTSGGDGSRREECTSKWPDDKNITAESRRGRR